MQYSSMTNVHIISNKHIHVAVTGLRLHHYALLRNRLA